MLGQTMMLMGRGAAPAITYATWNPADKATTITLSAGDLVATAPTGFTNGVRSTINKTAGKWYWENTNAQTGGTVSVGIATASAAFTYVGADANALGYCNDGHVRVSGGSIATYSAYISTDVIGIALDQAAGAVSFYKNGGLQGALTLATYGLNGQALFAMVGSNNFMSATANFGATPLTYTPPAGYNAGLYV
jgi:hypothetical protein